MLNSRFLAGADKKKGRELFKQRCGACHKLFGEGGKIGPDLTGSGRKDLHYILENVVDPSAVVNRNFQLTTIKTKSGRLISGMIAEENKDTVTVNTLNEQIILKRDDISELTRSKKSMMPELPVLLVHGFSGHPKACLTFRKSRIASHSGVPALPCASTLPQAETDRHRRGRSVPAPPAPPRSRGQRRARAAARAPTSRRR